MRAFLVAVVLWRVRQPAGTRGWGLEGAWGPERPRTAKAERAAVGSCPAGAEGGVGGERAVLRATRSAAPPQPLISLWDSSDPMVILRGLARSAIGMRRVSTPAS